MALRRTMMVVLAIMALHVVVTWGYVSLYWGDYGRWLYEVDRVAHGARIYRDVYWAFPPLAMWIIGSITRLIGSDLAQIWTVTSGVAFAIAVVYAYVVARLLPQGLAVIAGAVGIALGCIYSQQLSAPLAMGMYSPAVPIAFLVFLLQLAVFARDWDRPSIAGAIAVGALGGAGFLTKQDVWFACGVLVLAAGLVTVRNRPDRVKRAIAASGAFAVVAGAGIAVLASMYGVAALRDIFTGHGHVAEFAAMNFPDLVSLAIELSSFGLGIVVVALIGRMAGVWNGRAFSIGLVGGATLCVGAAAIWLWRAEVVASTVLIHGRPPLPSPFLDILQPIEPTRSARLLSAIANFRIQLLRHVIPIFVPLGLLVLAVVRRPRVTNDRRWLLLVVLLVVALALRSRRMISYTEWSALMLEIPIGALALTTFWDWRADQVDRLARLGALVLVVIGLAMHWRFGYGIGSRRGVYPYVSTARGGARIDPNVTRGYFHVRDVALRIDSSRTRPIFAFGYSAGFSYLLGRPSVGSMTQGMRLSLYPSPDSAYRVALAERVRLILVDNPAYADGVPAPEFAPWRWEPKMVQSPYQRADRPLFERLKAACKLVQGSRRSSFLTVYDCAPAPEAQ